ncbi:hypothetical protein [Tropicimonas marinistellae]|uniref:hypothetical protein n=1 Tax=Tropicimonas marinistellae TaxID=1739787 RepID=UPI00122DFAB3|nr:hypothetical protein [Tropicimonas marinistellae]
MNEHEKDEGLQSPSRRKMLAKAGKYAVVTPPTVSFLLSTAMAGQDVAKSGGAESWWDKGPRRGHGGGGRGGHGGGGYGGGGRGGHGGGGGGFGGGGGRGGRGGGGFDGI